MAQNNLKFKKTKEQANKLTPKFSSTKHFEKKTETFLWSQSRLQHQVAWSMEQQMIHEKSSWEILYT